MNIQRRMRLLSRRFTKEMLVNNIESLEEANERLNHSLNALRYKIEVLEKYSQGAHVASLTIACERISDALTHTLEYKLKEGGVRL